MVACRNHVRLSPSDRPAHSNHMSQPWSVLRWQPTCAGVMASPCEHSSVPTSSAQQVCAEFSAGKSENRHQCGILRGSCALATLFLRQEFPTEFPQRFDSPGDTWQMFFQMFLITCPQHWETQLMQNTSTHLLSDCPGGQRPPKSASLPSTQKGFLEQHCEPRENAVYW